MTAFQEIADPNGELVSEQRLRLLCVGVNDGGAELLSGLLMAIGTGNVNWPVRNPDGPTRPPRVLIDRIVNRKALRLGNLSLQQLKKIVSEEQHRGVAGYGFDKLVEFLGANQPDGPFMGRAPTPPLPDFKKQLKDMQEQGMLVSHPPSSLTLS